MPFVASKADGSALTAGIRRTPGPHLPNRIRLFERRKPMTSSLSRRALIKSAAGSALLAGVGMPAVVRGEAGAILTRHLSPLTGFLGPIGENAVMGVRLAADEINNSGGVMGRKIELVMEDSVNPQTASAKAERLIERDKVAMIIGEISSASGLAIGQVRNRLKTGFTTPGCNSRGRRGGARHRPGRQSAQDRVHQHWLQFRCAARRELQSVHVPHRGCELDVRDGGRP